MENWRNYVARISSLLVTGAILSACYAPVVTPTQPEIVTEPVASEVVPLKTEEPTLESTVTNTPLPSSTPSPTPEIEKYTVEFFAFHDFNGNGIRDDGEPPVEGILNKTAEFECTTNNEGTCKITDFPRGMGYSIDIIPLDEEFSHILPSIWEGIEIGPGPEYKNIAVVQDTLIPIPIAHGRKVLPIPLGYEYDIATWFDRDKNPGTVSNWLGQKDVAVAYPHTSVLFSRNRTFYIEDQHFAIDYLHNGPVVSSDSGIIFRIQQDTSQASKYDFIIGIVSDDGISLDYGHIKPVEGLSRGQEIGRGELLGYTFVHNWPPPFDREWAYMFHVGYAPPGSKSYSDSIDPYPDLWTSMDPNLAKVDYIPPE